MVKWQCFSLAKKRFTQHVTYLLKQLTVSLILDNSYSFHEISTKEQSATKLKCLFIGIFFCHDLHFLFTD